MSITGVEVQYECDTCGEAWEERFASLAEVDPDPDCPTPEDHDNDDEDEDDEDDEDDEAWTTPAKTETTVGRPTQQEINAARDGCTCGGCERVRAQLDMAPAPVPVTRHRLAPPV